MKYTVTVGSIGTAYEGPDVVEAEKKYAQWVVEVGANPNRPIPSSVTLTKRWEGKRGKKGEPEVLKEQTWGL